MTLTLTPLTARDAARFDDANRAKATAYRVADTRVSGVVIATRTLSGYGAPTHRPTDPTTGHPGSTDEATASYPAVWLTFGAQAKDTYVNTHDVADMYPEPFAVNGRDYHRVTVRVDFHPVAVPGLDVDYSSPQSRTPWNRMDVETARRRVAAHDGDVMFVENVPGTDGQRSTGVFIANVADSDRGEMTDAGRRTAERIAIEILRAQIADDVEIEWLDDIAREINGQISRADEIAHRWNVESARWQDIAVSARTVAVSGPSVRIAQ